MSNQSPPRTWATSSILRDPWTGLTPRELVVVPLAPEELPNTRDMWRRYTQVAQELSGSSTPSPDDLVAVVGLVRASTVLLICRDDPETVALLLPYFGVETLAEAIAKAENIMHFVLADRPASVQA